MTENPIILSSLILAVALVVSTRTYCKTLRTIHSEECDDEDVEAIGFHSEHSEEEDEEIDIEPNKSASRLRR